MTAKHDHLQYNTFSKKKNDQKEVVIGTRMQNVQFKYVMFPRCFPKQIQPTDFQFSLAAAQAAV